MIPYAHGLSGCVSLCRTISASAGYQHYYSDHWVAFACVVQKLEGFLVAVLRIGDQILEFNELSQLAERLHQVLKESYSLLRFCSSLGVIRSIVYEASVLGKLRRATDIVIACRETILSIFHETYGSSILGPEPPTFCQVNYAVSPLAAALRSAFSTASPGHISARAKSNRLLNILLDYGGEDIAAPLFATQGNPATIDAGQLRALQADWDLLVQEQSVAANTQDIGEALYLGEVVEAFAIFLGRKQNVGPEPLSLLIDQFEDPPDDFICPISQEVMTYPVTLEETGMTYDQQSISDWFYQCRVEGKPLTCPSTNLELQTAVLIPNTVLHANLQRWLAGRTAVQGNSGLRADGRSGVRAEGTLGLKAEDGSPSSSTQLNAGGSLLRCDMSSVRASASMPQTVNATVSGLLSRPIPTCTFEARGGAFEARGGAVTFHPSVLEPVPVYRNELLSSARDDRRVDVVEAVLAFLTSGARRLPDPALVRERPLDADVSGKLIQAGVVDALVPLLRGTDIGMATRAASLLSILCNGSYHIRGAVADAGAISSLVPLCEGNDVGLSRAASEALHSMAINHPSNKFKIAQAGGISVLVAVLRRTVPCAASEESLRIIAATLGQLAANVSLNKASMVAAGAIALLVEVLKACPGAATREAAAGTLKSLCMVEGNRRLVYEAGALEPLVDMLSTGCRAVQEVAAGVLAELLGSKDLLPQVAMVACAPLLSLLGSDNESCREAAVAALLVLAESGSAGIRLLAKHDAADVVNAMLRVPRRAHEASELRKLSELLAEH